MAKNKKSRGKRFRLLIYERMWKRWALPSVLIIPASIALWWVAPHLGVSHSLHRALAFVPACIASFILFFTFMARRLAWVQCRRTHLRVQAPIFSVAISYGRIKEALPTVFHEIFDPRQEKAARRNWLGLYWNKTTILVRLTDYPVNKMWLRLWLSPYLLSPDTPGLVLLVEDWMALSRQIDDYRSAWEARYTKRRQETPPRRLG
ncbi:MAG TPA: hypothetical protein ENN19_02365 [Chloroflexi bacterium]|nr:hypothetical protein [Chloroflexota bacterium]